MVNNGIVVFISGRGSNLNAIINAVNDGVIKYPISAVVSDRYCEGVEISRKNNSTYYEGEVFFRQSIHAF